MGLDAKVHISTMATLKLAR